MATKLPTPWENIGTAFSNYTQSKRTEEDRQRKMLLEDYTRDFELVRIGALSKENFDTKYSTKGMPKLAPDFETPEMARQRLSGLGTGMMIPGVPAPIQLPAALTASADTLKFAGMQTPADRVADQVRIKEGNTKIKTMDEAVAQERMAAENKLIDQEATNYVPMAINALGQPIENLSPKDVASAAFSAWEQTRRGTNRSLTPEQAATARAAFERVALTMINARKRELEQDELTRRGQNMMSVRYGTAQPKDLMTLVRAALERTQGEIEQFNKGMEGMAVAAAGSRAKRTPFQENAFKTKAQLEARRRRYEQLEAKLLTNPSATFTDAELKELDAGLAPPVAVVDRTQQGAAPVDARTRIKQLRAAGMNAQQIRDKMTQEGYQ